MIDNTKKITSWMMSMGFVGIFHSVIILIFFNQSGTMIVNQGRELFRGAFSHANSIGIILVPFLILYLHGLFLHRGRKYEKYYYTFIAFICLILIYLSKARGSIIGFFIAILITTIVSLFSKNMKKEVKFIIKDNYSIFFFLIILILISASTFNSIISEFILKGTELSSSNLSDVFLASRGAFMLISFQNFISNPLFGIGFGVPSIFEYSLISYDPIFNLPISAPVEKAFFFTAIIEEFGIVGTLIFLIFYFKMTLIFFRKINSYFFLLLYFSILTLSIFEFYFFSMGTLGSFNWLWIGFIYHLAIKNKPIELKKD
tara:strand:- start:1191 stop:2138 length:948 start_codon:yes stop_codon:yes gene_type:complete